MPQAQRPGECVPSAGLASSVPPRRCPLGAGALSSWEVGRDVRGAAPLGWGRCPLPINGAATGHPTPQPDRGHCPAVIRLSECRRSEAPLIPPVSCGGAVFSRVTMVIAFVPS